VKMDLHQKIIYSIIERLVKRTQKEERPIGLLAEALDIKAREVISLVGAGGKTTLMFRLAKELLLEEKKVVTTTTTKILEPSPRETSCLFINPEEKEIKQFVERHLNQYHHITIAKERLGSGKLKGVSSGLINDLWSLNVIDTMIIEADGATGRPIKAPRTGEPVIPSNTTLVVAMLGVDGVEMELNEKSAFQAKLISKMTGIPIGGRITDEAMAILMTHSEGIFKGAPSQSRVVAFLNKVDIPDGMLRAKGVAKKIVEKKHPQIKSIVLGQLKNEPPVAEVIFP
jgi:probable selenium-dependent hydroxylase accessory protein YqeC